eukprot:scaffold26724_cov120-Isochrysis_galbana.AAC.2
MLMSALACRATRTTSRWLGKAFNPQLQHWHSRGRATGAGKRRPDGMESEGEEPRACSVVRACVWRVLGVERGGRWAWTLERARSGAACVLVWAGFTFDYLCNTRAAPRVGWPRRAKPQSLCQSQRNARTRRRPSAPAPSTQHAHTRRADNDRPQADRPPAPPAPGPNRARSTECSHTRAVR